MAIYQHSTLDQGRQLADRLDVTLVAHRDARTAQ